MCGLAGILYRDPQRRVDADLLDRMTDAVAHRGPDDRGTWIEAGIGLGHRRLAIRDLSAAGHQPMQDQAGQVVVVFNGELYNDGELRRALEREHGARFHSTCDAEVLPAAFLAWGGGMFERLEGMFAIAVWDRRDRTLWLGRDAAGIKPLFVADDGEAVRFGSEVKALLADPAQPRRLALPALHRFLAQGYAGPDSTLLEGVAQVAPGSVQRIGRDGVELRHFWQPRRTPEIRDMATALDAFTATWEPVVESMLPSDVPLGVLLSGGIDSALIALTVGRRHPLPMFTAGFSEASHSETALATATAAVLGRAPTVVPVDVELDAGATLERVVHHLDGQLADSSAFAVYGLAREVRRHVTVVLAGDGADELFGGYPTYRASRLAALVQPVMPRAAADRAAIAIAKLGARSETRLAASAVAARFLWGIGARRGESHAHWRRLLPGHLIERLYGAPMQPLRATDPLAEYASALAAGDGGVVDRCLIADQRYYLPADMLMKVDAMSMAHALEVRVPYLDRRVMSLANRIDARLLSNWYGPTKHVLRRALAERGGPAAVTRGAKRGFQVPVARLLRGPLRALGDRALDRDAERLAPVLVPATVRALWQEHQRGEANHAYVLWTLLTLAIWLARL